MGKTREVGCAAAVQHATCHVHIHNMLRNIIQHACQAQQPRCATLVMHAAKIQTPHPNGLYIRYLLGNLYLWYFVFQV